MMDWISQRMKSISRIERYSKPEKSPSIKLDANENVVLDRIFLSQLAMAEANKIDLRKYPLDLYDKLYESLSKYLRVGEKNLLIGNGSDQIIELILTFIGRGKRVTLPTPTFSYFVSRCQLHGIKISKIPLLPESNTFERRLFMSSAKKSQLVYLCSPNNPTGGSDAETPEQLSHSVTHNFSEAKNEAIKMGVLKIIKGIGTVIERKLNEAGVYTFEQLGSLSAADLRKILGNTIERLANEDALLEQARDLARGK